MDASSLSHDATHAAADAPADTSRAHDRCRLKAVMANEEIAQDVLVAALDRVDGVPLKVKNDIRIAVEELFVNVASYAYASVGDIELSVTVDGDARGHGDAHRLGRPVRPVQLCGGASLEGGQR